MNEYIYRYICKMNEKSGQQAKNKESKLVVGVLLIMRCGW